MGEITPNMSQYCDWNQRKFFSNRSRIKRKNQKHFQKVEAIRYATKYNIPVVLEQLKSDSFDNLKKEEQGVCSKG